MILDRRLPSPHRILIFSAFLVCCAPEVKSHLDETTENNIQGLNQSYVASDTPIDRLHKLIRKVLVEIKNLSDYSIHASNNSGQAQVCIHGILHPRGYCVCSPDWYGDRCDFNPLLSPSYFPSLDSVAVFRRSLQASVRLRDAERLVAKLDSFQHFHTCGEPAEPQAPPKRDPPPRGESAAACDIQIVTMAGRGLGSWVHHMAGAFTWSVSNNKTLVLRYPYDYFFHDGSDTNQTRNYCACDA
jgi:hypothetical protein